MPTDYDRAISCIKRALELLAPHVPAPTANELHPLITTRAELVNALRSLGVKS